jgi:hypothetical protein
VDRHPHVHRRVGGDNHVCRLDLVTGGSVQNHLTLLLINAVDTGVCKQAAAFAFDSRSEPGKITGRMEPRLTWKSQRAYEPFCVQRGLFSTIFNRYPDFFASF